MRAMLMEHDFQLCRGRWLLLSGILCCVVASFLVNSAFGETARTAEPGLSKQDVRRLEQIALKMFDVVAEKDVPGLLKFISPDGISWGADGTKSYAEVEKDLRSGEGPLYCRIFGCSKSSLKSARTYFKVVKHSQVKVEVWYFKEASVGDVKFAKVFYHWPDNSKQFNDEFYPLGFMWEQKTGWKCTTLFEDY